MILRTEDKVKILVAGDTLQYGDIAIIKTTKPYNQDKPYYCFCPLRNVGEWFAERHLDKLRINNVKPPRKTSNLPKIKFYAAEKTERPPAVYDNLPTYNYNK